MRTLLLALSLFTLVASSANADWGRPGPGGPGWGPGRPGPGGPGHGPGWGPGPGPGPGGPGWGRPVPPPPRYETQYVNCDSPGYSLNTCYVNGYVVGAQVTQQRSFAACELGRSFGYQGNSIWVSNGCRGTFAVTIQR